MIVLIFALGYFVLKLIEALAAPAPTSTPWLLRLLTICVVLALLVFYGFLRPI